MLQTDVAVDTDELDVIKYGYSNDKNNDENDDDHGGAATDDGGDDGDFGLDDAPNHDPDHPKPISFSLEGPQLNLTSGFESALQGGPQ
ncbi:hypothetical protein ElyMa_004516800 [Elysia marginata]|uniref:CTNNB1 binding N-teminal domain-containing protein n=1 Tax=Elysia marginata TaxID=1093978 RepID=A0AAV4HQX9_9GAST|nr:hypothetical protein ElyMa_004516800 [Elysia marginata]